MLVGNGNEQGIDGDRGLAGADVGLQKPLHRPIARQILDDRGDGAVLIAGQRERKQPANMGVDGRRARQLRRLLPIAHAAPPHGQRRLQHQEFFVNEAPPCVDPLCHDFREVDLP